jgi:hypothetical protein
MTDDFPSAVGDDGEGAEVAEGERRGRGGPTRCLPGLRSAGSWGDLEGLAVGVEQAVGGAGGAEGAAVDRCS